ncbi:hypothetical protein D6B98_16050 [Bradyrhizobium sp. LVM 105]|nr:hypothetical protein D6B98_16050 [Bradyrhizobium sp. LVM 105]
MALESCRALNNTHLAPPTLLIPAGRYSLAFERGQAKQDPFANAAAKALYCFQKGDGTAGTWISRNEAPGSLGANSPALAGINIVGEPGATLVHAGDANSYLFATSKYFTLNIRGLSIEGADFTTTRHGIAAYGMLYSLWEKVNFSYLNGWPMTLWSSERNAFVDVNIGECRQAISLGKNQATDTRENSHANENRFYNLNVYSCGKGVGWSGGNALSMGAVEINFSQCPLFAGGSWKLNEIAALLIRSADSPTFENVYFEYNLQNHSVTNVDGNPPAAFSNHVIIDPTQAQFSDVASFPVLISNASFRNCYIGSFGHIYFNSDATHQAVGVHFQDCLLSFQGIQTKTGGQSYTFGTRFSGAHFNQSGGYQRSARFSQWSVADTTLGTRVSNPNYLPVFYSWPETQYWTVNGTFVRNFGQSSPTIETVASTPNAGQSGYTLSTPKYTLDCADIELTSAAVGTTVGAAGAASAPPAAPAGYLSVMINGAPYKLPYYN